MSLCLYSNMLLYSIYWRHYLRKIADSYENHYPICKTIIILTVLLVWLEIYIPCQRCAALRPKDGFSLLLTYITLTWLRYSWTLEWNAMQTVIDCQFWDKGFPLYTRSTWHIPVVRVLTHVIITCFRTWLRTGRWSWRHCARLPPWWSEHSFCRTWEKSIELHETYIFINDRFGRSVTGNKNITMTK